MSLGSDSGGKRRRIKVSGRTKTEAARKLTELRQEIEGGVQPSGSYTAERAADDWLANGMAVIRMGRYAIQVRPYPAYRFCAALSAVAPVEKR